MRRFAAFIGAMAFAALSSSSLARAAEIVQPEAPISFEGDIRPILKANCLHCHGGEGKAEGSLDLRLRRSIEAGGDSGPAFVSGDRAASLIYERALAGEMPPTDHKLAAADVELIGKWIDAGAPLKREEPADPGTATGIQPEDRQFWAYQPVARPAVPPLPDGAPAANPIDAFIRQAQAGAGLHPSPEADKRTLLLRASFDLTGLPPTSEEAETFLNDSAPDAYERLVDRLLASPRYGERWGRHWLDVAGYAESDGYVDEDRPRPYAYKYRDYVIRAFNADMPVDRFIVEQLAGDELVAPPYANLPPDQLDKLIATGFLRMGVDGTGTNGIDEDLARNQTVAETIKIVSTSLLGLTVGCAQCHDHRYDPIPHTDYHRLRAVFEPAYNWKAWRGRQERLISLFTDADRQKVAEVDKEIAVVAAERAAKETEFIQAALAKELEKYPEEQRPALKAAFDAPADQRTPEQTKLLDDNPSVKINSGVLYQYNQGAADELKKFDSRIGEIAAKKPVEDFIQALTEVPGQIPPTFLFHRGDHQQPKQEIAPGDLTICSAEAADIDIASDSPELATSGRRLAYARWLTSGRHPLVARVLMNRVWMLHFGRGIVGTPSDFGRMGELPSHPQLLDWLASELVAGGWRLKPLHKLMLTSATYRQASRGDAAQEALDPENRQLWRMPVRRLEAEAIRDRILAASGALNPGMFGPSTPVTQDGVGQFTAGEPTVPDAPANVTAVRGGPESRRSVYLQVRRSQPIAMLRSFDAPVMETNCDRRVSSTVAPQALMLMNSGLIVAESKRFAWRVKLETGADRASQIRRAWQLAYCREPSADEQKQADEFLARQTDEITKAPPAGVTDPALQALTNLCQALLSSNEFLYVD